MFNWHKGFGWVRTAKLTGREGQLDSLGAAVKILSSYGKKLSVENLEVLLAIGALGGNGNWVNLRELKAKLPELSSYQLSRNLAALGAKESMIDSLFAAKEALIQTRIYEHSQREKEVSLTDYGLLILNRSIQTISSGFASKMAPRGELPAPGLLKVMVSGDTSNGKKAQFETNKLLSIGHIGSGIIEASFPLCGQAIAQGATVYWLSLRGVTSSVAWLYSLAKLHARDHAFYANGDVNNFCTDISPQSIFDNQGICYHVIDLFAHERQVHEQMLIDSLSEIADAAEQQTNIAGAYIVIDCSSNRHPKGLEQIKRLISAGVSIHIIDPQFDYEYDDSEAIIASMIEQGFDIADYRFKKTGIQMEGHAWFVGKHTPGVLLKMDYVKIPMSKTIEPVNEVKKGNLKVVGQEA
jgi:DNA-binding MarR family transcriptional regulator